MNQEIKRAAALGAVLALAAAPAALATKPADPGSQGKGHSNGGGKRHWKAGGKGVMYVFKGAYQPGGSVAVDHGNAHVRKADLLDTIVEIGRASCRERAEVWGSC